MNKEALAQPEQKPMHPEMRKMWEDHFDKCFRDDQFDKCFRAQPVREPVAWREFDGEGGYDYYTYEHNEDLRDKYIERNGEKYASWFEPLYTTLPAAQRTWVGLTDKEAMQICVDCGCLSEDWLILLDAIELKLKEKNNAA